MTAETAQTQATVDKSKFSRKTLRKIGRDKRKTKLATDVEFRKAYFEGRAKRSEARKQAYRKRHAKAT